MHVIALTVTLAVSHQPVLSTVKKGHKRRSSNMMSDMQLLEHCGTQLLSRLKSIPNIQGDWKCDAFLLKGNKCAQTKY